MKSKFFVLPFVPGDLFSVDDMRALTRNQFTPLWFYEFVLAEWHLFGEYFETNHTQLYDFLMAQLYEEVFDMRLNVSSEQVHVDLSQTADQLFALAKKIHERLAQFIGPITATIQDTWPRLNHRDYTSEASIVEILPREAYFQHINNQLMELDE